MYGASGVRPSFSGCIPKYARILTHISPEHETKYEMKSFGRCSSTIESLFMCSEGRIYPPPADYVLLLCSFFPAQ